MLRKLMSLIIIICILFTSVVMSTAATYKTDYSKHQSSKVIIKWDSKGLLTKLISKGKYKPDTLIKKAEFIYLINRVFNYTQKSNLMFSDVSSKAWYYNDISKAIAAGYIEGGGKGMLNPEAALDKQTAINYLYKAFQLNVNNKKAVEIFSDFSNISVNYRDAVSSMVENGYVTAIKGTTFKPNAKLTRVKALELLDKLAGTIENNTGVYKGNITGNVVVNTKDIALKDMVISGNLYLSEGIGAGNIRLENVKVKGQTFVRGGGENSISIINSSISGKMSINKGDGKVRVVAKGSTVISNIYLGSGAVLQESGATGKGFENIFIQKACAGQLVKLNGTFTNVTVQVPKGALQLIAGSIEKLIVSNGSPDTSITISSGLVSKLDIEARSTVNLTGGEARLVNIQRTAADSKIVTAVNSVISNLIVFAKAKIEGIGTIKTAEVISEGVSFDKKPVNISIKEGITVNIAGKEADNTINITSAPTPVLTPSPTPTPTSAPVADTTPYFPPSSGDSGATPTTAPAPTPTAKPNPTPSPIPNDTDNIIANGNFEINPFSVNGWNIFSATDCDPAEITWETYQKDGEYNHCIKLSADAPAAAFAICTTNVPIKPGMKYTFSVSLKDKDVVLTDENCFGAHVFTIQGDENDEDITETFIPYTHKGTNEDWTKLSYDFSSSGNAASLFIQIGLRGSGQVWFDDVRLVEIGPAPTTTPTPIPTIAPTPTPTPTPVPVVGIMLPAGANITDTVADTANNIMYVVDKANSKVYAVNYVTESISEVQLTLPPERIALANNKLYVTLLKGEHSPYWWDEEQQGAVAILNAADLSVIKQFDIDIDPFDIVVGDDGYIYITSGSGQSTLFKSYSESSMQMVSQTYISDCLRAELHPVLDRIYTINTDSSPYYGAYDIASGIFSGAHSAPYQGYSPMYSDFRISPDGMYLFNSSGLVQSCSSVNADDMKFVLILKKPFSDIAFDLSRNTFYTAVENRLVYSYNYTTFQGMGTYQTNGDVQDMYFTGNELVALSKTTDGRFYIEKIDVGVGNSEYPTPPPAPIVTIVPPTPGLNGEIIVGIDNQTNDSVIDPSLQTIYYTDSVNNKIGWVNYQTGERKEICTFYTPESIALCGNEILAGYGNNGIIGIYAADTLDFKDEIITGTVFFDLAVGRDGFIYINSSEYTRSFSRSTKKQISYICSFLAGYFEVHPTMNALYVTTEYVSPEDLLVCQYNNGMLTDTYDSPYHGDYEISPNSRISPDGKYIFNGSGNIFSCSLDRTQNLHFVTVLNKPFSDIAFDLGNDRFFTAVGNKLIYAYKYSLLTGTGVISTIGNVEKMYYDNGKLVCISKTDQGKYILEIINVTN